MGLYDISVMEVALVRAPGTVKKKNCFLLVEPRNMTIQHTFPHPAAALSHLTSIKLQNAVTPLLAPNPVPTRFLLLFFLNLAGGGKALAFVVREWRVVCV